MKLLILAVRTGRVRELIELAIWAIRTKASYDEAMDRLSGKYYDRQVHEAADKYLANQPPPLISQVGYERWKKEQGL